MSNINFELVTDLQGLIRRDFTMADKTLVNPNSVNPIMDGEYLSFDTAYKLVRGAAGGLGFAVFAERGRFDVQVLGKTTVLFAGHYEADTRVFTSAGLTLGGKLQLSDAVTVDTKTKSGLLIYASGALLGYVTRLPANNGGKLRYLSILG
jgi:hypothetical protein